MLDLRCQYDEYVFLYSLSLSFARLSVPGVKLHAQDEGTVEAETPGKRGRSRLIIDALLFDTFPMQFSSQAIQIVITE